jgi:hypothetical protein
MRESSSRPVNVRWDMVENKAGSSSNSLSSIDQNNQLNNGGVLK